jgi:predicted CopG family antitoxin
MDKNFLELFKLYLHYISIPVRILIILIAYFIAVFIACVIGNNYESDTSIMQMTCKLIMCCLSINLIYDEDNLNIFNKYAESDLKFITIFNHTNLIEPFILLSLFKKISYLLNESIPSFIPFFDIVYKKLNYIYTKKGKTSDIIIEYTKNRKKGEGVLFVAPGGGKQSENPDENLITEFKSGAFVGLFPILPIIIKYDDTTADCNFDKGEHFLHGFFKVFLKRNRIIKVKVLDLVRPEKDETINEFKERVHNIMSIEYKKL